MQWGKGGSGELFALVKGPPGKPVTLVGRDASCRRSGDEDQKALIKSAKWPTKGAKPGAKGFWQYRQNKGDCGMATLHKNGGDETLIG